MACGQVFRGAVRNRLAIIWTPVAKSNVSSTKRTDVVEDREEKAEGKRSDFEPPEVKLDFAVYEHTKSCQDCKEHEEDENPSPQGHLVFGNPVLEDDDSAIPFCKNQLV